MKKDEKSYLDKMEKALMIQLEAIRERREMLILEEEQEEEMEGIPEMVCMTEAMKRSGMSRPMLTRLCNTGSIPHIRVGESQRKILINYGALEKYMRTGKTA